MRKTENKNDFVRTTPQTRFPKINIALGIDTVVKNPFIKNSRQTFVDPFNVKKVSFNRLLSSLNANVLARLQPYLESISLSVGQSLYHPQDRIRYVYFPETAVASDLQMLEDGRTVEIAMTGREGVTGLATIFNSQNATNWTEVVVAGNALRLNAQIFKQEFAGGSFLQNSLFSYVNSYVEQISRKVVCNNYHQLKERFCCWLLMLQNRSGGEKLSLTHEQISRFLGVHRPGISNVAKELREQKTIDYRRGQIIILDYEELKRLSCSCFCAI